MTTAPHQTIHSAALAAETFPFLPRPDAFDRVITRTVRWARARARTSWTSAPPIEVRKPSRVRSPPPQRSVLGFAPSATVTRDRRVLHRPKAPPDARALSLALQLYTPSRRPDQQAKHEWDGALTTQWRKEETTTRPNAASRLRRGKCANVKYITLLVLVY
jgi:hypothetical protein